MPAKPSSFYDAAWALVAKVPAGRVVTYGQVATALGSPRGARAVGYAMFYLAEHPEGAQVPWQRVVNARGEISIGGASFRPGLQRRLLEKEGVTFDCDDRIDLKRFRHILPATRESVVASKYLC